MLTITKGFHFSASHVLDRLPSWHPCARMHGHNYVVVLELPAPRSPRRGSCGTTGNSTRSRNGWTTPSTTVT